MRRRSSTMAILLAVLLPGALLGWTGVRLHAPPSLHGYAADLDARLAATDPQVIVLGSSMAHRGFDLDLLAHELGLRPDQVVLLQLPHASAAHWYAMLENRVFAHGYKPKLILVAGAMTTMLNHELLKESANVDRLVEQMSQNEPVIARKVFHFDNPEDFRADYLRERASEWRDTLVSGWRNLVVTAFFSKRRRLDDGQKLAEKVDETVFANDRMDYGLHRAASDGLHDPTLYTRAEPDASFELRRDALLPDMQALVDAHGARLVWVRMPFAPSNPHMDDVPPEIEQDALSWMDELGSGWLDLRALELDDSDFEDMRHLSKQGATQFTLALAHSLNALGALRADGSVRVVQGLRGVVGPTRVGDLPPVPVLTGEGCLRTARDASLTALAPSLAGSLGPTLPFPVVVTSAGAELPRGDADGSCSGSWSWRDGALVVDAPTAAADVQLAWRDASTPVRGSGPVVWVWPGTSVQFHVNHGWDLPPKAFQVLLRALALDADGARATVSVGGEDFQIAAHGPRIYGVVAPPPPTEAWTLSIGVPSGAPPMVLHHLAVGAAPATVALLGATETLYGGSVRVVGGRVQDTFSSATYAAPPAYGPVDVTLLRAPQRLAQVALPRMADLADALDANSQRPSECSPLRVLEDGVPLASPHAVCQDVLAKGQGRTCHAGEQLFLSASDDTNPLQNGRSYALALDPTRACETWNQPGETTLRGSWWLYPGDTATLPVTTRRLATFREGANLLEVAVIPNVTDLETPLLLTLLADDRPVMEVPWDPGPGTHRPHSAKFAIDPPLPVNAGEVSLRVTNPSATSYVLLSMVTLSESYSGFGPKAAVFEATTTAGTAALPLLSFERSGLPPVLPPPRPPTAGDSDRTFESRLFASWPFSNAALDKIGAPKVSPLRVNADGEPLPLVTTFVELHSCPSCFMHAGQAILYTAPGGLGAVLSAHLDGAFPFAVADGTEAWWVYPGEVAQFEVELPVGTWEARLAAYAVHTQKAQAGVGVSLLVGEAQGLLAGSTGGFGAVVPEIAGGRKVLMRVQNQGSSYVLIDSLKLVAGADTRVVLPRSAR